MALRPSLPSPLLLALLALPAATALRAREACAQIDPDGGRTRFQSGRAYYDRGDYQTALTEFRASLVALPSPNTMLYIGRALRELGRNAEAWRALNDASDDARRRSIAEPRYARTAETAHAEAAALSSRLAFITVTVPDAPAGTVVELNGQPLEATGWNTPQAVDPPTLTLDARAPGRSPFHTSNAVSAGLQAQVAVNFDSQQTATLTQPTTTVGDGASAVTIPVTPAGSVSSPWRPIGVVAMGLGVAAIVTGTVFGLRARASESDLEAACPRGCPNSAELQSLIADGYQSTTIANVGFGVGAGLLVVGALAVVFGHPTEATYTPDLAVHPFIDPNRGTAGLQGTF